MKSVWLLSRKFALIKGRLFWTLPLTKFTFLQTTMLTKMPMLRCFRHGQRARSRARRNKYLTPQNPYLRTRPCPRSKRANASRRRQSCYNAEIATGAIEDVTGRREPAAVALGKFSFRLRSSRQSPSLPIWQSCRE